jgi:hypothetical protein
MWLTQDYQSDPSLLPGDIWDRARGRIVIARFNENFVPLFYRFLLRCVRADGVALNPTTCEKVDES